MFLVTAQEDGEARQTAVVLIARRRRRQTAGGGSDRACISFAKNVAVILITHEKESRHRACITVLDWGLRASARGFSLKRPEGLSPMSPAKDQKKTRITIITKFIYLGGVWKRSWTTFITSRAQTVTLSKFKLK